MRNNSFSEDELWKELLNGSFFDMLRSVLPEMARGTETSKPIRFLETELRQLAPFTRRFSSSQPFIDILAEAPLLTEENAGTLHHEDIGGGVRPKDASAGSFKRLLVLSPLTDIDPFAVHREDPDFAAFSADSFY